PCESSLSRICASQDAPPCWPVNGAVTRAGGAFNVFSRHPNSIRGLSAGLSETLANCCGTRSAVLAGD
ncbi:hypothetical protein ABPG75_004521, partial [Micractinium tetrahymenae]